MAFDLVIRNGSVWINNTLQKIDLGIKDGKIVHIGSIPTKNIAQGAQQINADHLCIFPGAIDTQVHFRDPGLTHKETLYTGTRSAILGGVTTIFDMPNTKPNTISGNALAQKLQIARSNAWCHFAFFMGGVPKRMAWSKLERLPGCSGIKIFLGSSTGNLLVDKEPDVRYIFENSHRRLVFHSEDEARLVRRSYVASDGKEARFHPVWRDAKSAINSTEMIVRLAKKYQHPIHVLHVTTQEEMSILARYKGLASVEVTPQHLSFNASQYQAMGSFLQMNPPIRKKHHQDALWQALRKGVVNVIGSDHAPHTRSEKAQPYPQSPAGMPGVQTTLTVMLTHMQEGRLSMKQLTRLLMHEPSRLYGIQEKGSIAVGKDADLVGIDLKKNYTIQDNQMGYRCGWTPFHGFKAKAKVTFTILNGALVMQDQEVLGCPSGRMVSFRQPG